MLITRLAPSPKGNLHEMAKLYVTRVTSRRSSPMRCHFTPNSGHRALIRSPYRLGIGQSLNSSF